MVVREAVTKNARTAPEARTPLVRSPSIPYNSASATSTRTCAVVSDNASRTGAVSMRVPITRSTTDGNTSPADAARDNNNVQTNMLRRRNTRRTPHHHLVHTHTRTIGREHLGGHDVETRLHTHAVVATSVPHQKSRECRRASQRGETVAFHVVHPHVDARHIRRRRSGHVQK